MPFFRKKPVVIEAVRVTEVIAGLRQALRMPLPDWVTEAGKNGDISLTLSPTHLMVKTLEGDMAAEEGDWLIKGVKGELYPCKPDIFDLTYDEVTEEPTIKEWLGLNERQTK